ncbi:MAG: SAM-dependent methyltransferase [Thermohalobaculum sp.]|nr:SAM-dependent methyltransferase [Thermohalobaculum sp.]
MTPLGRIIARQIGARGPIGVADYMALCLGHPAHGYYTTRDPLGAAGDFTTAPEISQMFGEMVGLWLRAVWEAMGAPTLRLVELGPGRGTLMQDARRAMGRLAEAETWLVETSPRLRAEQARRLPAARWAERLDQVPEGPALIVANEFLDALPVRQFLATPEGWRERQVGLAGGRLIWGLSGVLPGHEPAAPGAWREEAPAARAVAGEIARRIAAHGGAALMIDYGYRAAERPPGWTLQALRRHAAADPLDAPGEADLTWLVDFDALAADLAPLGCRTTTQGAFLGRMGIGQRAAALARARPDRADTLADALERLTGPEAMGTLFKVLAALPVGAPTPPGFAEDA